jgi:hypothetical protein
MSCRIRQKKIMSRTNTGNLVAHGLATPRRVVLTRPRYPRTPRWAPLPREGAAQRELRGGSDSAMIKRSPPLPKGGEAVPMGAAGAAGVGAEPVRRGLGVAGNSFLPLPRAVLRLARRGRPRRLRLSNNQFFPSWRLALTIRVRWCWHSKAMSVRRWRRTLSVPIQTRSKDSLHQDRRIRRRLWSSPARRNEYLGLELSRSRV